MSELGDKVIAGLKEFEEALANGEDVTKAFKCTTLTKEQAIAGADKLYKQALRDEEKAWARKQQCLDMLERLKKL